MNIRNRLCVLAGIVTAFALSACVDDEEVAAPRLPAAVGGSGAVDGNGGFSESVQPLLIEYCSECHNPSDRTGGFDMTTYSSIAATGRLLVAGDADASLLVQVLETNSMPPVGKPRPSAPEIAIVRAWIAAGALNN